MNQYLDCLKNVFENGTDTEERTGTGQRKLFGMQMRFNLKRFPLVSCKYTPLRLVIEELLWILSGSTNNNELVEKNVHIWTPWANQQGELGPIYGHNWRNFSGQKDQITELLHNLKTKPFSRRHVISAWDPMTLPDETKTHEENIQAGKAVLPPCHCLFQFSVFPASTPNGKLRLSCQLYQRSADMPIGVPFNIASYSLFVYMIAHVLDMEPFEFIWTGGECHIYHNQFDEVKTMLSRQIYESPTLDIVATHKDLFSFKAEDFKLNNYKYNPSIKMKVAV